MIVLTLNSGSSSIKFGLYRVEGAELTTLLTGNTEGGELKARGAGRAPLPGTPRQAGTPEATIAAIVRLLGEAGFPAPDAIGHRIVHGGAKLRAHCLIDGAVEHDLRAASAFAPLHAPAALAIIGLAGTTWSNVPQTACFDTTFHAGMPDVARVLPVDKKLLAAGVQRYGFHGLSCESIVRQLGAGLPGRLIIAHLGAGASVTAVHDGRSIDTSMGLTPSGGIIMATRSGDLDPGVLIYLLRERGFDAGALEEMIDHRSGLLGISGVSGDLRSLHEAEAALPGARLAIAMFCMSAAKQIAGMIVALGGVDAVVFTGGIGEHDAAVRAAICDRLGWAGLLVDDAANRVPRNRIDADGSRAELHVLPSQEDEQIALHTGKLVADRA